ncbi:MAG: hypothetical protein ABJN75_20010 [Hoeflea sp.]|uniref:hypothetical protein n=1 Tax=Hoeflea sp. TaxID=1940281 RepID=UPI0032968C1A|tara:strand:+ start:3616 stop:3822 length:207 start_codon:yes stop_codon:yes gene_type:complete
MTDIKPWWQSRTLWGAIVTLGSAALGLAGLDLGDADREALIELMTSLGAAIGGVIAIFGRITAKNRIG